MKKPQSYLKASKGFALLEVFIAMLIITILISSLVIPGLTLNNYSKRKTTHNRMQHVQLALNRYLETHGRLPCPVLPTADSTAETIVSGECTNVSSFNSANHLYGSIPVDTIGISREYLQDGWGNKIMYIVPTELTFNVVGKQTIIFYNDSSLGNSILKTFLTAGNLHYSKTLSDNFTNYLATSYKDVTTTTLTNNNIYLLLSNGENGLGAYTLSGTQNSKTAADTTLGEDGNFMESKTDNIFYTNKSKGLRGGKLDDILYTTAISDIVSVNSEMVHCDFRHSLHYAQDGTDYTHNNAVSPVISTPIPANSQSATPGYTHTPHYHPSSLINFQDTCATCPNITGRRLYAECLKGGKWSQVIHRSCTC